VSRPLPMFPLGSVLFPTMPLVLHVFEERYRALTRHCLGRDREFGVVLIERGHEVGGGDVRFGVGTRARIVEAVESDDGRFGLGLVGLGRIRVDRWLPDDPYPQAQVSDLDEGVPGAAAPERRDGLERVLRRVLALKVELGEPAAPATVELDPDPGVATYQAAALAPLGPADAQHLLETPGADERLELVVSLLEDEAAVLAQRVAGG
jgi:uncharacterized protein